MISADRKLIVTAAWTLTVLGTWSIVQRAAQAEEVKTPRQIRFEFKVSAPGIPELSKIPYLGRLFVNAEKTECCEEEVAVSDNFERIGLDFENVCEVCPHVQSKSECEKCEITAYPGCKVGEHLTAVAKAACKACTATSCPAEISACCKASQCPVQVASAEHECKAEACDDHDHFVSARLAELVGENMVLESALEAKQQMLEIQNGMWERFASLMAEKVQLQAQLDFAERLMLERQESAQKIQELAQENSRLQNEKRMTAMYREVEQSKQELAQENARLKDRVAELELVARKGQTEVRVAKKPREPKTEK